MRDARSALSFGVIDLYLLSLAFDLVWSVSGARLVSGARMAVPDWLSDVVPEWLAEVMRPKKAPVPWGTMARAVLALWVPMAVGFATGRRELALLPAMGGLLSITIDTGGPYWSRVERIGTAAVLGGAPGLFIGTLIHGRGWVAVVAVVVIAGVSAILARLGGLGSVTGLQLFLYSALGLGPLGALRPWWHTALQFLVGVAWALLLITPGYLLSPKSAERKAVAEVYHALARDLRLIGTPGAAGARVALAGALNAAYDTMLTGAGLGGRAFRAEHAPDGRAQRESPVRRGGRGAAGDRGAGAAAGHRGDRPARRRDRRRKTGRGPACSGSAAGARARGGPPLPLIPPQWSSSPGALALREAMVSLVRVLSGNWTPAVAVPDARGGSPACLSGCARGRSGSSSS